MVVTNDIVHSDSPWVVDEIPGQYIRVYNMDDWIMKGDKNTFNDVIKNFMTTYMYRTTFGDVVKEMYQGEASTKVLKITLTVCGTIMSVGGLTIVLFLFILVKMHKKNSMVRCVDGQKISKNVIKEIEKIWHNCPWGEENILQFARRGSVPLNQKEFGENIRLIKGGPQIFCSIKKGQRLYENYRKASNAWKILLDTFFYPLERSLTDLKKKAKKNKWSSQEFQCAVLIYLANNVHALGLKDDTYTCFFQPQCQGIVQKYIDQYEREVLLQPFMDSVCLSLGISPDKNIKCYHFIRNTMQSIYNQWDEAIQSSEVLKDWEQREYPKGEASYNNKVMMQYIATHLSAPQLRPWCSNLIKCMQDLLENIDMQKKKMTHCVSQIEREFLCITCRFIVPLKKWFNNFYILKNAEKKWDQCTDQLQAYQKELQDMQSQIIPLMRQVFESMSSASEKDVLSAFNLDTFETELYKQNTSTGDSSTDHRLRQLIDLHSRWSDILQQEASLLRQISIEGRQNLKDTIKKMILSAPSLMEGWKNDMANTKNAKHFALLNKELKSIREKMCQIDKEIKEIERNVFPWINVMQRIGPIPKHQVRIYEKCVDKIKQFNMNMLKMETYEKDCARRVTGMCIFSSIPSDDTKIEPIGLAMMALQYPDLFLGLDQEEDQKKELQETVLPIITKTYQHLLSPNDAVGSFKITNDHYLREHLGVPCLIHVHQHLKEIQSDMQNCEVYYRIYEFITQLQEKTWLFSVSYMMWEYMWRVKGGDNDDSEVIKHTVFALLGETLPPGHNIVYEEQELA